MNELKPWIIGGVVGAILGGLTAVGLVETEVVAPPPETPAVEAPCPSGWEDKSSADEHTIVLSCERNNWLVILNPDGSFSHGVPLNTAGAGFVFDPREVPEWPAR
jgi:hypothetical protein